MSPTPERPELQDQRGESFARLVTVMRRLLSPDGCPWDREQTYASLRPYVLEEACEVIDAIDQGDGAALCEELGDLALQIAFLSELGRAEGAFGPDDVMDGICDKLVRRHPHVFGDADVRDADHVVERWEAIKAMEKGERGLLDGIPRSLPALERARKVGHRTRSVGFDWPEAGGSRAKVDEELGELDSAVRAGDAQGTFSELGDALFALVNYARHLGVDPEAALRATTDRYVRRFAHVERCVRERGGWPRGSDGKPTRGIALEQLDEYWNEAKRAEAARE